MRRVKIGLIGGGFIGAAHIEAVRRLGFVDIVALAEVNKEHAERRARELYIPKAYGDYHELLDNTEIEVVHNCTPNFMHYEVNKAILESGRHVISEKPLTMNSSESWELVRIAEEKNLLNAVDFNYRQFALVQEMKARVVKGEIGKVYLIHGGYLQDWLVYDTDYNWRLEPELGGRSRAVADIR